MIPEDTPVTEPEESTSPELEPAAVAEPEAENSEPEPEAVAEEAEPDAEPEPEADADAEPDAGAEAEGAEPEDGKACAAELMWALQCVLFVAGEPLPVNRIAQALGCDETEVPALCRELNNHLLGQGLHVVQLAGGHALATRPDYAEYVQRLLEPEPERLSVQALETLAIIAYRQPLTRPEIDSLRGVNSGGVVASLLEKGLIRITGRKDVPGRPFLLETTAHFLSAFGLKDLADMPRIDLPEVPSGEQPKLLGEALEELSAASQEDAPSAAED